MFNNKKFKNFSKVTLRSFLIFKSRKRCQVYQKSNSSTKYLFLHMFWILCSLEMLETGRREGRHRDSQHDYALSTEGARPGHWGHDPLSVLMILGAPWPWGREAGCLLDNDGKEGCSSHACPRKPEIQLAWASPLHPSSNNQRTSETWGFQDQVFY